MFCSGVCRPSAQPLLLLILLLWHVIRDELLLLLLHSVVVPVMTGIEAVAQRNRRDRRRGRSGDEEATTLEKSVENH